MTDEQQRNLDVVRQLARCWNAGDPEALLALYDDRIDMVADPEFLESDMKGKAPVGDWVRHWMASWESLEMVLGEVDVRGDQVVAIGSWKTRSEMSGIDGHIPWGILYTLRGGLVVRQQWFLRPHEAREATA